jgi:hypothetical protein
MVRATYGPSLGSGGVQPKAGKGFGSRAENTSAMAGSMRVAFEGHSVVKLPADLVRGSDQDGVKGEYFDTGRNRMMKESWRSR